MDANRTALLVDDEPASQTIHQARLEDEGYTVFVARNQTEALGRARQTMPAVIFVHLVAGNLPLIQALRSDDTCRNIPVVVITDHPDPRPGQAKLRAVPHEGW